MSLDLYRLCPILDISHSIRPAKGNHQHKRHLLYLIWISDVRILQSESTGFQTTEAVAKLQLMAKTPF